MCARVTVRNSSGCSNAGEAHEVADRVLVDATGMSVAEIGEPLDLRRHVGQAVDQLRSTIR